MRRVDIRTLRKILEARGASVRWQGGNWIATTRGRDGMLREWPLHYSIQTERAAIEYILCRLGVGHRAPDPKTQSYIFVLN